MKKYLLRMSRDYSTVVEAEDEADAIRKGVLVVPLDDWDSQAWSEIEAELYEEDD